MADPSLHQKIFTIHELNSAVRELLHTAFPDTVWVCGEVQSFRERNGIMNFDLLQKDPEKDQVIAKAAAVVFQNFRLRVLNHLREVDSSLKIKNDIEIKVLCRVDFYPKNGQFSLRVVDIDPSFTLGQIAQNRQKLINELTKKGLLQKNKQVEFPVVPLRLGLITSRNSAAYHDFLNELTSSGYGFQVFFHDAYMQGKLVETSVCEGLAYFRKMKNELDVIVITRGGGATADLAWFDNKKIAENIADFPFPVLTGLGHQIDLTVTDLVAHTTVKTPTKAAQFLTETVRTFVDTVDTYETGIKEWTVDYIDVRKKALHHAAKDYETLVLRYFRDVHTRLVKTASGVLSSSRHALRSAYATMDQRFGLIKITAKNNVSNAATRLKNVQEKISLLDPETILKRGYSVTTFKGKALKDADQVKPGDVLRTHLYRGEVESTVTKSQGHKVT